ncbi:SDR family oxidoreductase [Saccharothrix longispora]|uniref:Nucleoside-diphosphate-sugar epimerase n=1 Tax=Saccharothrix longispora TaxID=33920 RepID=A0ABU1PUT8_9PSEU|nr:SDR family oxidoreductase [Saccharothrix longispora]MDR6594413.1 nucleoside-diphosphate-sugar epimerase [Saccharothrix longispora]
MADHVVDGANGFVASHLIGALVARGDSVVALARAGEEVVRRRVADALTTLHLNPALAEKVQVERFSLAEPELGTSTSEVFAEPCTYWHSAALITFFPRREAELHAVNVVGSANAAAAFSRHAKPGSRYVHVGTAYQHGTTQGKALEQWPEYGHPSEFRNDYEHSKRTAEVDLSRTELARKGAVLVARLGVMVGHSGTGRALSDLGIYDFIRVIALFARRTPGERVRFVCHPRAALHLTPVDGTVDRMLALAAGPLDRPVRHLVPSAAVPVTDVFAAISRHLPVELVAVTAADVEAEPFGRFEAIVNMRCKFTSPYFRYEYGFESHEDAEPPPVTPRILDLLISWYVREGLPE